MIRYLIILGLSLSLGASILAAVSKASQRSNTGASNIQIMTDEIARIEDQIAAMEEQKIFQPEIQTHLARLKVHLDIISNRDLEVEFFDWWTYGLQPILILVFLVYFLKNKKCLAEQDGHSDAEQCV